MARVLPCIGFLALFASSVCGQTGGAAPKFESVDIHASAPNTMLEMRSRFFRGRYELREATTVDLIRTAWGVDADKVVGGPEWLDTDRFDLIATAPANATPETLKAMLRKALAERFQLVAREDTKGLPAYAITIGKKSQLKQAEGSEASGCRMQPGTPAVYECRNITMAAFAKALPNLREASGYLFNYPVVDRTGLGGAWNFRIAWTPRVVWMPHPAAGEVVSIFDAFEKQLGLKLSLIDVPTPVVAVKSANPPHVTEYASPRLEFEVADIKPDPDGLTGSWVKIEPGGRVRISMSLKGLIGEAWEDFARSDRIVGATKAMDAIQFVVIAKAPAQEGAVAGWNGPVWNGVDVDSMRKMLRALLVDRFKLQTHYEERLVNGYELVAAKPKLRKADPANRPACKEGPGVDGQGQIEKDPRLTNPLASRLVTCRNMTLTQFARAMNQDIFGLPPVVDATGIAGRYDFTINFSPASAFQNAGPPNPAGDPVAVEPNGAISFSEAMNKQLGLKLQGRKVVATVLVIDRVNEMPTEN